jgi:drug/metabolite transporter (DMT)-like permease
VLSVVFLRERLGLVKLGALLLALTGTALTIGVTGRASALGLLLGMGAAVFYAIYILVGSRIVHQTGSIASSAIIMASAAIVFAGLAAIQGLAVPQRVAGWAAVGAIALISTVIAFVTFFAGLKRVGPVTASTLSTCEPVVTVVLAALVLGETISFVQLLGGVLILLAAVTLVRSETRQQKRETSPRETGTKGGVRRVEEDKSSHR